VAVKRDVTREALLERQLLQAQKMEAVGTLAGGIAHDFNNLLQVVLGYSELILMGEGLDTRLKDDLNRINQAARNGADLVHRLLTFSRKTEIKPRPLNLNHQIDQVRKLLYRTVSKMIEIELVLDSHLAAINADPTQVEQILMNLAVNARDAMPDGGKLVIETENVVLDEDYCKTHLETAPGHYVLLTVSDSGQGMDRETLEHIFEPFYTTKRPGEGTGLGLAMVYGIVKQHQGYVTCYSEPGRGTTFKIYFPALVSGSQSEEALVKPVPRGGSETILLVDDEALIRDLGGRILTRAGYRVLTAVNGRDALEVYTTGRQDISLVILDLIMPEMGGKQCLEEILKIDTQERVLIASGYSVTGSSNEALAVGAKGFVNKPYDMRELLTTVREVLDEEC
jgi:two-component system cell cycle sensor histidine kinase/response regulator CckA